MIAIGIGIGVTFGGSARPATAIPQNTSLPVISGIRTVGQTVTCSPGGWDQPYTSAAYQWQNAGSDIGGATNNTYVLQAGDQGDAITCEVEVTNTFGTSSTAESASITPAAVLSISGSPTTTANIGTPYSFTPTLAGGHTAYVVTLNAGALPAGLSLNSATGAITGTPTIEETKTGLVLRVTDADGLTADLAAFQIAVTEAAGTPLDLDFTTGAYIHDGTTYPDWATFLSTTTSTFTRASAAYEESSGGLWTSRATDVARINSTGLLYEGAATNLFTRSGDASNGAWSAQFLNIITPTTGPLGTSTAYLLADSVGGSAQRYHQQGPLTVGSGATVTHYRVVKQAGATWVILSIYDSGHHYGWFDIGNGVVGTQQAGNTGFIKALGNGFYLCAITRTITGTSCYGSLFLGNGDNTGPTVTVTIGDGVYQDTAQLVEATGVSSYIATAGASATRSADVFTIKGLSGTGDLQVFYDGSSQTISAVDFTGGYALPTSLNAALIERLLVADPLS